MAAPRCRGTARELLRGLLAQRCLGNREQVLALLPGRRVCLPTSHLPAVVAAGGWHIWQPDGTPQQSQALGGAPMIVGLWRLRVTETRQREANCVGYGLLIWPPPRPSTSYSVPYPGPITGASRSSNWVSYLILSPWEWKKQTGVPPLKACVLLLTVLLIVVTRECYKSCPYRGMRTAISHLYLCLKASLCQTQTYKISPNFIISFMTFLNYFWPIRNFKTHNWLGFW